MFSYIIEASVVEQSGPANGMSWILMPKND